MRRGGDDEGGVKGGIFVMIHEFMETWSEMGPKPRAM